MTIFTDLDGVLADFDKEYERRFKEPCPGIHALGEVKTRKWDNVHGCGDFFLYMPWTTWGREMWSWIRDCDTHVLTAYPRSVTEAAAQKIQWCSRELSIGTDRIICVQGKKNKILYCQPGDVLLDDNEETVKAWTAAGGRGFLITPDHNVEAAKLAAGIWLSDRRNWGKRSA